MNAGTDDAELWRTRRTIACAAVGLPFASAGVTVGLWLAFQRLATVIRG